MIKATKKKVAKRPAAQKADAPATPAVPAPVSTTLSPQATELVQWYCGITRHRQHDAVEGAVFGTLERAKDAYEDGNRHDESFNWLMEDVLKGMYDDARAPLIARYGGGYTVQLSVEASELVSRFLEASGDPRDIVSGAVESMLGSALDDTSLSLEEAIQRAKERRLLNEAERQRRNEATAAFYARKEVAA